MSSRPPMPAPAQSLAQSMSRAPARAMAGPWRENFACRDGDAIFPLEPGSGKDYPSRLSRRGAGVVDRGGLENRCTRKGTEGSNPSLSATKLP